MVLLDQVPVPGSQQEGVQLRRDLDLDALREKILAQRPEHLPRPFKLGARLYLPRADAESWLRARALRSPR